jgi:hypothetical protein
MKVDLHGWKHMWALFFSTESYFHQSTSLTKSRGTLSITTGDLRNESMIDLIIIGFKSSNLN